MSELYLLKDDVVAEPLVNRWYAWCHLVSPVTFALISQFHHLELLRSYTNAPHLHRQAAQTKELIGGPFLDFDVEDRTAETSGLIADAENKLQDILNLAIAIKQLNQTLLQCVGTGCGFEDMYQAVPAELAGYVELTYDLNNFPSIRLMESLLYRSRYYRPDLQSVLLHQTDTDKRPFILSTPRFSNENDVEIKLPFASKFYDTLFAARFNPIERQAIIKTYEDYGLQDFVSFDQFIALFDQAEEGIKSQQSTAASNLTVQYFGHACVLIKAAGVTILIDPLISYATNQDDGRLTFRDLPDCIDYVLITHAHQDHAVLETLLQLRHRIKQIIVPHNVIGAIQDPSLKLFLNHCGFNNVIAIDEMEEVPFIGGRIVALPTLGEHADLNIQTKLSYLVCTNQKNILFLADSKNLMPELYRNLASILPKVDVAFIGMECEGAPLSWLYGSLMLSPLSRQADQSRRLDGSNCEQAQQLIELFHCKEVYVYAMGYEPWLSFISSINYDVMSKQNQEGDQFIACCHSNGIKAERLYIQKQLVY